MINILDVRTLYRVYEQMGCVRNV